MLKRFNVTFKENKKYNANTRTISVDTEDRKFVEKMVYGQFGGIKKITIINVEEADITK